MIKKRLITHLLIAVSLLLLTSGIVSAQEKATTSDGYRELTSEFSLEQVNSRYFKLHFNNILPTVDVLGRHKLVSILVYLANDSFLSPLDYNWALPAGGAAFKINFHPNSSRPKPYTIYAYDNNEAGFMETENENRGNVDQNIVVDSLDNATAVSSDLIFQGDARKMDVTVPISFDTAFSGPRQLWYRISDTKGSIYGTTNLSVGNNSFTPEFSFETLSDQTAGDIDFFKFSVNQACGTSRANASKYF